MKIFLITCLSISCGLMTLPIPAPGAAEAEPANPAAVREKLERLHAGFERHRAEALRPLAAQYVAKLEALQREAAQQNREAEAEVAKALAAAREIYARLDQPEVRRALTNATWIWQSNRNTYAVVAIFQPDGTVEHIGMRGHWRVSGPNEVTVSAEDGGDYVLRLAPSLKTFNSDRDEIVGTAVQMPIDTLCGNIWTLRDDKLEFLRDGRLVQLGRGWEGQDWRLSKDGNEVTIRFTNGNGGTFKFENGAMTHFDGSQFQKSPRE